MPDRSRAFFPAGWVGAKAVSLHLKVYVAAIVAHHDAVDKVQGSRFFIIRHIHNHTSIISSEMQVELKKNTALHEESEEKKITPRLCSLGSTV